MERKGQRKVKKTFFWTKMSKMSQLFEEIPANKPKEEHSHTRAAELMIGKSPQ